MAEKKIKGKEKAAKKTSTKKKVAKKVAVPPEAAQVVGPETPVVEKVVSSPRREKKIQLPKTVRYYGTGRRKEAMAKVWLIPGTGKITVNSKAMSEYFCGRKVLEYKITRPLIVTKTQNSYDVVVKALGGGVPGQAG
ncbi:MAG: 30S ribosomal protein S9, partial [bacterium]